MTDESKNRRNRITEQTGNKQPENSTDGVLNITLFLVAINGILGEMRNVVNGSFFADDLAICYNKKSNDGS